MDKVQGSTQKREMKYARFFAMVGTSTIVMFGLMYLNTYLFSHVFFSETRAYMAIVMGAVMAIIMLAFMLSMYPNRTVNIGIFSGSVLLFVGSLWLVRSQVTVGDASYMRAMIPHHSIAIMTSSRANISDPRVRKLADEIIYAQDKEIAEMRYMIATLNEGITDPSESSTPVAAVASLEEALSSAEIAIIDPEFMSDEELSVLQSRGDVCTFSYTQDSPPVLAFSSGSGLVKLSGDLVALETAPSEAGGISPTLETEGLTIRVSNVNGEPLNAETALLEADLILQLDAGLNAGYRGYFNCET